MEAGRKLVYAATKPSLAMEAIYTRDTVAECYVGQWIATFATQYELLGADLFDRAYAPGDLAFGQTDEIYSTPIGKFRADDDFHAWRCLLIPPEEADAPPEVVLAGLGPVAFAGLQGVHQNTSQQVGANQNFVVQSVSERACREIRASGGFQKIVDLTRDILEATKTVRTALSSLQRDEAQRVLDAAWANPMLSEIRLYVHPMGIKTVAEVARKEMAEHAKPVYIRLYRHGVDDEMFRRYRRAFEARDLETNGLPGSH